MSQSLNIVKNKINELPNNIEAEQSVIGSILLTNEIFDESHLRDSNYNYGCIKCKTKDSEPETGLYCWDCFGYEYGIDAYEFIENNYVIDTNKKELN